ncbi:MAG: hypothetical protein PCFJNLEI_01286 [Verrucomicrobiae bacterium]|nr:hypothetical protein [Verrucomicrobiae bacterium]
MDCKKAQRSIHELGNSASPDVQRHVNECSDCRVAQQRSLHLQQLLAVKRHESPGQHYFDSFLTNFHHRLDRETTLPPTLWQRLCTRLHIEPAPRLRYGFVHALGVVFAIALMWQGLVATDLPVEADRAKGDDTFNVQIATGSLPVPSSTPQAIASALPAPQPPPVHTLLTPSVSLRDFNSPRYVLDRIALTPASYEVASIHF